IRNSGNKCVIEGTFDISNYKLDDFFNKEDIDHDNQTIIRREILISGKSRAFINDTPVTLPVLAKLGDLLIDIHGQHQTLSLGENQYQFQVIDILANTAPELKVYREEIRALKKLEQKLSLLKAQQATAIKKTEYNLYLLKELQEAKLKEGQQEIGRA